MNLGRCLMRPQYFWPPLELSLGGVNNEMTNTMMIHIHLYKENVGGQVGGEFTEEKNFTRVKKNWWDMRSRHFRLWLLYNHI